MAKRRTARVREAVSLTELFQPDGSEPAVAASLITLGTLALSLNVPVSRLVPLVVEGYLHSPASNVTVADPPPNSYTYVETPSQAALLWLRQWFQPARAKLLFSRADVAEILELSERGVVALAAHCRVPVSYDPALDGLVFSVWAVKRLLMAQASGGVEALRDNGQRFDRQALLWMLLERDPKRMLDPPDFDDALEDELARAAKLPEPSRTARAVALWDQWQDARLLAEAAGGVDPAKVERLDMQFSQLRQLRQDRRR